MEKVINLIDDVENKIKIKMAEFSINLVKEGKTEISDSDITEFGNLLQNRNCLIELHNIKFGEIMRKHNQELEDAKKKQQEMVTEVVQKAKRRRRTKAELGVEFTNKDPSNLTYTLDRDFSQDKSDLTQQTGLVDSDDNNIFSELNELTNM